MAKILLIETSTALCSAAIEIDGKVVSSRRDSSRQHASLTAVFCDEVLREAGLKTCNLDAVCIGDGPGSYTGLRVGLSTAKGLCFGAGIRMLSVSSLDVLAAMACPGATTDAVLQRLQTSGASAIIPMIDARRMEVFTAIYDAGGNRLSDIVAKVIDYEGIITPLGGGPSLAGVAPDAIFIGDGALKCKEVVGAGTFIEAFPDAAAMAALAEREYTAGNWRDIAYFEPFYLKDYIPTVSKKKIIPQL